jgi:glycosyltransferase involved in cell wall biosynthesis
MSNSNNFSVVICAYTEKRWDNLVRVVESVKGQSLPPGEIIVVVDHNATLFSRAKSNFQGVTVIENSNSRGLSGARNSGIAAAQGEIIAFIDDDAFAEPDWLAQLNAGYKEPTVQGVGGLIKPEWRSPRPKWFPGEFNWVVGCTYRGMPEKASPVRNLIGCNMSFRREVFATIGGFRIGRVGTLSIGQENDETEFCIRLQRLWPEAILLYRPEAVVHHEVTRERSTRNYYMRRCFSEGLSKARLSKQVGLAKGTSTERRYVLKTLPASLFQILAQTIRTSDLRSLEQVSAILVGLATTVTGYLVGNLGQLNPKTLKKGQVSA